MSISSEINRISANVSDTLSAISEMGGTVSEGATSDNMAAGVRSIPVGAAIDDTASSTSTTYSSSKIEAVVSDLNEAIANKANDADLAAVAKSGSYTDLTNKPTIPAAYTLPTASASVLGGVMPVAKTDAMTQAVGVDEAGGLWTAEGGGDNKNIEGNISTIASGTIPAGTAGRTIIDTGVTFGEMLNHKLVCVYLKTTVNCTYLVTFHFNPTMYYHGAYITSGDATAGYIALENCGKTMRAVTSRAGIYSTVPSGFSKTGNFVTGDKNDSHNFRDYLKPSESSKLKIIPWIAAEETTPIDATWSITALE